MVLVKDILSKYGAWSGQLVNYRKSGIFFSANVPEEEQHELSSLLGVELMEKDAVYLGFPLFMSRAPTSSYHFLIRLEKKLQGWKANLLSHAGREVLIKSSLASIPSYHMSMGILPKQTIAFMERYMRNFYWGFSNGGRHCFLKAWDALKLPKSEGGLGFRDLTCMKKSLLMKRRLEVTLQSIFGPDS